MKETTVIRRPEHTRIEQYLELKMPLVKIRRAGTFRSGGWIVVGVLSTWGLFTSAGMLCR